MKCLLSENAPLVLHICCFLFCVDWVRFSVDQFRIDSVCFANIGRDDVCTCGVASELNSLVVNITRD